MRLIAQRMIRSRRQPAFRDRDAIGVQDIRQSGLMRE
jgi:hypothetical protein